MRYIASRLGFDAHLASVDIILDGVSIAHLIVLTLRFIINLPEQAVSGHGLAVVHPHGAMLRGLHFPTVDPAAAQDTCQNKFSEAVHHASQAKRSIFLEHNNLK